ncbi:MAG: hypothetical protein IH588_05725, partial [Anaerolineales bacterium]|nr:hypothetical protein [Anaerolineales bacterium]
MKDAFWVFLALLLMVASGLFYLAMNGNLLAIIVMASVWTICCVLAGSLIVIHVVKVQNDKAQQDFIANSRENLQIVQNQQRLQ